MVRSISCGPVGPIDSIAAPDTWAGIPVPVSPTLHNGGVSGRWVLDRTIRRGALVSVLVIVDTNALYNDPAFQRPRARRLLALCQRGAVDVAVPEVVLLELRRQHAQVLHGRLQQLAAAPAKARESLRVLGLDESRYPVSLPDVSDVRLDDILDGIFRDVRERLQAHRVEILPMPRVSHQDLLELDLRDLAPFDGNGRGYRDALIWHTIVARWAQTPAFENAYIVTNDDDFADAKNRDKFATHLQSMLPFGSNPVRVRDLEELLEQQELREGAHELQTELEEAALREELGAFDTRAELDRAAEAAVSAAIDALYDVWLSREVQGHLDIPREFDEVEITTAAAMGDFELSLYEQLDGDTMLGQGSMTADAELRAEVHKQHAALLADPGVSVESWDYDVATITFNRVVRATFDLRLDLPSTSVSETSLAAFEAAG
jgi:hypothetical protein